MAYDIDLEKQIRGMTSRWKGIENKKMFGGIHYLVDGKMSFGV